MVRGLDAKTMRRRTSACSITAVLISICLSASAAGDDSDERRMQAQTLFDQGQSLTATDPKAALGALRSSYEIHADFRVLYNIGKVCVRLADSPCAIKSFEQYLKDGGAEISAKRKKEVEAELKTLGGRGTSLMIKSSIVGAYVKVDGVVIGRTPLPHPVSVKEGSHQVVLVADGKVIEKSVRVATGAHETLELELKKEEPAPVPVAPPIEPAHEPAPEPPPVAPAPEPAPAPARAVTPPTEKRHVPLVPWIVTGAFAAGTVVTGVLTASAQSDYTAMRDDFPVTKGALEDAQGKGRTLLFVTGALGAATLVSAGIAAYYTFFNGSAKSNKTVGTAITGRALDFAVGPTGITIFGRLP